MFKTYDVEPAWRDFLIWEVARATSAVTTFFDPIRIGRDGIEFIDAAFGYNNACEILRQEAEKVVPEKHTSCVVSIGNGLKGAIGINSKPFTRLQALANLATSSRAVHSQLQESFAAEKPQKYWRFDEDVAIGEINMTIGGSRKPSLHTHTHTHAITSTRMLRFRRSIAVPIP
ncbi:hypothetical protein N657DRAFT_389755 [Parathielavia appendiculata]|uniref:Uncharacterized protein n=1 Tax=Parathielavia appendiculata TaxID=2587402 RepID=A0AAN6U1D7_9PEZI|nr:hypothetical protein N657DRAFT_389755 [Parathielavia appendiculata]